MLHGGLIRPVVVNPAGTPSRNAADQDVLHAAVVLASRVIPFFRPGETASEFANVTGADQAVHGGVIAWRHRPVIAGGVAAPDPPPRIPPPEPLKLGIVVAATVPGVHRGRRRSRAAGGPPAASPVMASARMPRADGRPHTAAVPACGWRWGTGGRQAPTRPPSQRDPRWRRPGRAGLGAGSAPPALAADDGRNSPASPHCGLAPRKSRARPGGGRARAEETFTLRNAGAAGPVTPRCQPWRAASHLPHACCRLRLLRGAPDGLNRPAARDAGCLHRDAGACGKSRA